MDSTARIEAYKAYLRIKYEDGVAGLRTLITEIGDGAAAEPVLINQQGFEGGQATGQITLEPLARLQACIDVLRELDPDNMPDEPAPTTFADFSLGCTET